MNHRCRYCGEPIKKFLIGWMHDNDLYPGLHWHIARPRR